MSSSHGDVVIIGGGFAGTALAYFLARSGAQVLLLEAGTLCSGTSAACAGRAQIIESETEDYLDLVLAGFSRLEGLGRELEADLEWEQPGHLTLLFSEEQMRDYMEMIHILARHGVRAEMLDLPALRIAEPMLRVDGCLGAVFSPEGHLNPFSLCMAFARAARRQGAVLQIHTRVTGFESRGGRITSVLAAQERFSAASVVLAAGAWSGGLAESAGDFLPMCFTHAEAAVSEPLPRLIHHHIGMSGFYEAVHGQPRALAFGLGQHRNGVLVISNAIQKTGNIDSDSTAWGMPALGKALLAYFPGLKNVHLVRTWAAPSPFLPDYRPAIGWMPGVDNLYVAAGFHLAVPTIPLLAEASARSILQGKSMDASPMLKAFSPDRFVRSRDRLEEITT